MVAESEEGVAGFVTCHVDGTKGSIGLIAVDERARGKGLGAALVLSANSWFREAGVSSVTVVTQGANLPAQRLYQAAGFASQAVEIWFHLTLSGNA